MTQDTIYALASGRPPAAIAVVRVSGPAAHPAGTSLAGALPEPRQAAVRNLRNSDGELLDQALLLRFDAPSSATGEDVIEFHCHGGRAVVDGILDALSGIEGLRIAHPGEFTRRAFENGRIDLTEAEGLADLLEAETASQRRAALLMARGGLRHQVDHWNERILELSARAEVAIDYVDEDGVSVDPSLAAACGTLAEDMDVWLERPRAELLRDGIQVVLAGPPNSGKSSLLNALVGSERAIVTDVPGTTRDRIEVPLALSGTPYVIVDTAGIRHSHDPVETIGVELAMRSAQAAEILVWLGEPAEAPQHSRTILVHSRADLPERSDVPMGSLAVSSVSGIGLREIIQSIEQLARELLPSDDAIVLNARQAGELATAVSALRRGNALDDAVLVAEELRYSRAAMDRVTGRAGIESLLNQLFGRFCLGK